jgi:hypothetical protein
VPNNKDSKKLIWEYEKGIKFVRVIMNVMNVYEKDDDDERKLNETLDTVIYDEMR